MQDFYKERSVTQCVHHSKGGFKSVGMASKQASLVQEGHRGPTIAWQLGLSVAVSLILHVLYVTQK